MTPSRILAVGSVALDSVKTPFGQVKEALGGSAVYFSAAARFFSPVAVVAVVGRDFPAKHLRLLRRLGVDTVGVKVEEGRTFRWKGAYDYDLNVARTLKTELNVFQTFRPLLHPVHRQSRSVFLANIDPDIQRFVLHQVQRPLLTACDTMNFWIEKKKPSLLKVLKQVDVMLLNEAEARQLSGEVNLVKAARWVLSHGPKLAVIKKGEHGVICFFGGKFFSLPGYPLEKIFDPTGAGDSFAGGFLGTLAAAPRVTPSAVRRALVYGSVLASYNVESFSLRRLASLKPADIRRRHQAFRHMAAL